MKGIPTQILRWTAVMLGSFALLTPLTPSLRAQTTSCATITDSAGSVPIGFGAPYNVLSSAKEILIDAQCNSATGGATINVGSGGSNQYIYNQGYVYKNSAWVPLRFTAGTGGAASGAWITAKAKADLTASQLTSGTTYVVGYVCQQVGSAWKCGCRDNACTMPMWQLQAVQPPPPPSQQPSGTTGQTCTSDAQCGAGYSCWYEIPRGPSAGIKGSTAQPGKCLDNTLLQLHQ